MNKIILGNKNSSVKSLEISKTAYLLAKKNGFKIDFDPFRLKTFHATYSHLIKAELNSKIYLINNYRGNFRSANRKYILNGKISNPGTANLYMFLPHLAFEKDLILITPPLDKNWIDYLVNIGIYKKNSNINNKIITINLSKMDSSPIEVLLKSGAYKQISYKSLLVTTFNDALTKKLVQKRKLLHNQNQINSYEGNSKIDQRKALLPMAPSIEVHNRTETIEAGQKLFNLGIKKVWVKCGNNVGAGQFMRVVALDGSEQSLINIANTADNVHEEQCKLMDIKNYKKDDFTNAEIMIETDINTLGRVLLEGSVYLINNTADKITICHYAKQIKDPTDSSRAVGGMNFLPDQSSLELLFPSLMQQLAIHAAVRQRKRNYFGLTSIDLFIVEMTRKEYKYYIFLLEAVGLLPERVPIKYYNNKLLVAILGEINERESITPVIQRIAINLNYKSYISTTLSELPEGFDFVDLEELVKKSRINISEVIPFTRKPVGIHKGIPYYNGANASFYIGIFSRRYDVEKKYKRLMREVEKIKSEYKLYENK